MGERGYRSIGEVLAEVQDEFPEITISKIRFLESQGLIDPERTPSGYRKFYDHDVQRLRAILRSQREDYLPLKVIRDRLDRQAPAPTAAEPPVQPARPARQELRAIPDKPQSNHPAALAAIRAVDRPSTPVQRSSEPDEEYSSAAELAAATQLDEATVRELESFGLVRATETGRTLSYGAEAAAVCRAARHLLALGLEPRHLRIFRTAADREADLYEQAVLPLLKQRNPQARAEARDRLSGLSDAGARMHAALLAQLLSRLG